MPLPAYLARAFQRINPETTQEGDYYGAYTMLLVHAFPGQEGYVVHPQVAPHCPGHEAVDFVVCLIIYAADMPVFFVEAKPGVVIRRLSARAAADEQMRGQIEDLFDRTPSEIHGVSALGQKLCFYCYDKPTQTLTPQRIPRHPDIVTNTAPADRWDTDIMTDEGFDRFMDIVEHVKTLSVMEGGEAWQ